MNRIKDKLLEAFRMYFILFTLISVLLMVLGLLFDRDRVLGYEVFISPLLYAAIGVIPVFFFREDKEISMKRLIIRRLISLGFIELTIMVLAFSASSIRRGCDHSPLQAVGIAVVFVLSGIVEYVLELGEAQNLNKALAEYQNE